MKEVLRKILFYVSLVVFIGCSFKLYTIWKEYHDNTKSYDDVRQYAPEIVQGEGNSNEETAQERFVLTKEDYNNLLNINSDFKAWINIPNTEVNYPVVQTEDNDYYLSHNFEKEQNAGGCLFISSNNTNPFQDKNTIIHGHHMRNGSMFASLMNFKEEDFARGTSIYINTENSLLEYKAFSVFYETANNDSYQNGFASNEAFLKYINVLKEKSMFDLDVGEFTENDTMITLSTCDYDVNDGRLLVCAKLVSKSDY